MFLKLFLSFNTKCHLAIKIISRLFVELILCNFIKYLIRLNGCAVWNVWYLGCCYEFCLLYFDNVGLCNVCLSKLLFFCWWCWCWFLKCVCFVWCVVTWAVLLVCVCVRVVGVVLWLVPVPQHQSSHKPALCNTLGLTQHHRLGEVVVVSAILASGNSII